MVEIKKYICKYCCKEFDNKQKLGGHVIHCKLNPKYLQLKEKVEQNLIKYNNELKNKNIIQKHSNENVKCKYCGKEFKYYGLINHERLCKENPNRQESSFANYNKNRTKYSNQYIKAKELGLSKPEISEETKQKLSKIWKGRKHKDEIKQKIKESVQRNINNDNWHLSFSKARTIEYKGYKFQGSWEVAFAKYLDNLNIKWERPNKKFDYIYNNDNHKYLPDFYLPKYNLYIEIKGYPTQRDFCKWEQFTDDLDIYFGDDLYNLGIIESYKDRYKNIDNKFRIKHLDIGSVV